MNRTTWTILLSIVAMGLLARYALSPGVLMTSGSGKMHSD
jgi:hypothetical protein